jgi:hypothetical protein
LSGSFFGSTGGSLSAGKAKQLMAVTVTVTAIN